MVFPSNITTSFKVLVRCFTYNQSQYIEDALNGFAMQQTNFPFVCLVMDDCSTDGEQEVIKAYLDRECDMSKAELIEDDTTTMTLVPHRTNVNCTFAAYLLKKNLHKVKGAKMAYVTPWREHCEYEALCEGDDYWMDPDKLQKQVDFLECHDDYSMCIHRTKVQNESRRECIVHCEEIETREYFPSDVFPRWTAHLSSFMFRCELKDAFPLKHPEWLESGDTVLLLRMMHLGRVWGMEDCMSVYRMNDTSLMSVPNDVAAIGRYIQHLKCFLLNFPLIDKSYCYYEICTYDHERFIKGDGERSRLYYLFDAWRTSPSFMISMYKRKIKYIIKRILGLNKRK